MNTQSRDEFDANWDRQVGCPAQYEPAVGDAVWSEMLASDPVGATWGTGVRRAPQTATWGWNAAVVGKTQTPTLMVAGQHDKQVPPDRVRELYADLARAAEGVRRSRLLVAQRDVGEEPPADVPGVARLADDRIGQRHEGRHAPPGILMVSAKRRRSLTRSSVSRSCSLPPRGGVRAGRGFGGGFGFGGPRVRNFKPYPNAPYDGRFNFVRVIYECEPSGYWYRGLPSWAHGYPTAEQNLMKIMNEVSYFGAQETINT